MHLYELVGKLSHCICSRKMTCVLGLLKSTQPEPAGDSEWLVWLVGSYEV